MLDSDIIEKELNFEQIEKGTKDEFPFSIDTHTCRFFIDIINESLKDSRVILKNDNDILNLMSVCLFSTFVGICIPGRKATFVDFSAFFEKNIVLKRNYLLRGEVSFKSESTNILLEDLQIIDLENDKVNASGKVKVKVNEQPVTMPSSADLAAVLNLDLKGKVALITGASGGIGETTAKVLALYGVKVIVNYLNGKDEAYRIVEDIRSNGGEAFPICADVSDRLQVKNMVSAIIDHYGTVDILVNNAVRKNLSKAFIDLTWEEFQKDIDVNLKGTFNCCQEVIPYMTKAGAGKIINMGTIMTDDPAFLSNDVKQVNYVASKSAVVGLTRALALELAPLNIQVNIVCPHLIDTDLTRNIPRMYLEKAKNETPMNRLATPADVSKAIVFLASSLCSFTTGQKLMVTGGNPPFL
jgi:3-oxoacyl-[acyl-carrier protein] reductase